MTFPILASAFLAAAAALLALRSAAFAANKRSTVKVRGNRRQPAGGRRKTID